MLIFDYEYIFDFGKKLINKSKYNFKVDNLGVFFYDVLAILNKTKDINLMHKLGFDYVGLSNYAWFVHCERLFEKNTDLFLQQSIQY